MKGQRLILRLDDAAERMDIRKWDNIEKLLDRHEIKPLVGVIPDCQDPKMSIYDPDPLFWTKVHKWIDKGWSVALHGYHHVYDSDDAGINPVNNRSEYAGHDYKTQAYRIREGLKILRSHDLMPNIFFAPGHTFDENTLKAILQESDIRIISDTMAWDAYREGEFLYIPVQSGVVRRLPFKTVTYCYHPNMMSDTDFTTLDTFLDKESEKFIDVSDIDTVRERNLFDRLLSFAYRVKRRLPG